MIEIYRHKQDPNLFIFSDNDLLYYSVSKHSIPDPSDFPDRPDLLVYLTYLGRQDLEDPSGKYVPSNELALLAVHGLTAGEVLSYIHK